VFLSIGYNCLCSNGKKLKSHWKEEVFVPDPLVLCNLRDAQRMEPHLATIAEALGKGTSVALVDIGGPKAVALIIMPWFAAQNAARFQIIGLASHNPVREGHLEEWRDNVGKAWAGLANVAELTEVRDLFLAEIEVWPIMPVGIWGLFEGGKLLQGRSSRVT
jgi:hypothetical protein